MFDLLKEIDFSKEITEESDMRVFILEACKKIEQEESEILRKIKKPELDDELLNQFIISGIPILKPENEEKFLVLFRTKLLDAKKIGDKNGLISIEVGKQNGVGNQTLFMTYKTILEAKSAFNKLNNFKFDKNHTLQCFTINEIRGFIEEDEETQNKAFQEPVVTTTEQKIKHNLDEQMRGQFLVREANMIYLNWLDHLDKSSQSALSTEYMPVNVQVNKVIFSPLGSYLAVCCADGIHIYVGATLKYKCILKQVNPIDAKFSNDERFLITSNGGLRKNRQNFVIWALEEQFKLKTYRSHANQNLDCFQFSDNSQNLAIILQNEITFYQLSSIQQLQRQFKVAEEEQHILKAPHVQKIAWLKGSKFIIVMCFQIDYNPVNVAATKVFLYNLQTRQERKWRAWSQHAKNGQIFVSQRGDWVAISMKKFVKKNHFATAIQIGNLLKKEEPLEITSLQIKEEVGNISWDWQNNRFAVISEDESTKKGINVRFVVSFYEISTKNKSIQIGKIGEIKDNLQNRVALAGNGNFFALYNITEESPQKGKFSLGLITRETKEKGKRSFGFEFTRQNNIVNGMNVFSVDSSGRFVLLGTDKGYQIWNFIGEIVTKDTLQKAVHDVQWRPRLMNQLPQEEERILIEKEKDIRKRYEQQDDRRINALKYQKEQAKLKQKILFQDFVTKKAAWFKGFTALREKALGFKEFESRIDKYEVEEGFIDLQ